MRLVWSAEKVVQRMTWIIDSKRVENASVWATEAGLSRTYVSGLLERVRKGKSQDIGLQSLAALAQVARVSPAWLAFGAGEPSDDIESLLPPLLRKLLKKLPAGQYPDLLLSQAVMVLQMIDEADLPEDVWQDYVDGLKKEVRRVGLEVAASRLEGRGFKR